MTGGHEHRLEEVLEAMWHGDWCPFCADPEGPTSQERTLQDHCAANTGGRACPSAWKTCERCGAYGSAERYIRAPERASKE